MNIIKNRAVARRLSVLFVALASILFFTPAQPSMADTTTNVSDNCDTYNSGCSYGGDLDIHYNTIAYDGYYSAIASFYGNVYSYAGRDVSPNGATVIHYKYVFGKNINGVNASGTGTAVKNQGGSVENCAPPRTRTAFTTTPVTPAAPSTSRAPTAGSTARAPSTWT